MCFVGGFDTQYMDKMETTEEQIRESVDRTVDGLAPGGSWIPWLGLTNKEKKAVATDELVCYGAVKYTCRCPDHETFGKSRQR